MESFLNTPTKVKTQLYFKLLDTKNTLPEWDPVPRNLYVELLCASLLHIDENPFIE